MRLAPSPSRRSHALTRIFTQWRSDAEIRKKKGDLLIIPNSASQCLCVPIFLLQRRSSSKTGRIGNSSRWIPASAGRTIRCDGAAAKTTHVGPDSGSKLHVISGEHAVYIEYEDHAIADRGNRADQLFAVHLVSIRCVLEVFRSEIDDV